MYQFLNIYSSKLNIIHLTNASSMFNYYKTVWSTCLLLAYMSVSMAEDANYCRNPDFSSKPWCYVEGETGPVKENCDIPSCGQLIVNIQWENHLVKLKSVLNNMFSCCNDQYRNVARNYIAKKVKSCFHYEFIMVKKLLFYF